MTVEKIFVRNTRTEDFSGIEALSLEVYPTSPPWNAVQLGSHLRVFPEGQFVAIEQATRRVVGMAASLVILWDDYDIADAWRDFTDNGMFSNHDPARGRTLYGAEVIVNPEMQRRGIGRKLYAARRALVERLGLLRIRAGARIRDYHRHAERMTAEEYVVKVVNGKLRDRTLTFQLKHGFHVLAVVSDYLQHDPESRGYAAVIEWINEKVARPEDYSHRNPRFRPQPPVLPPHAAL